MCKLLKTIDISDVGIHEIAMTVEIPHGAFLGKFGQPNVEDLGGWDAPGPVELWCYELPWGLRIILEYNLTHSYVNIFMGLMELEAVVDFLGLHDYPINIHNEWLAQLRTLRPEFFDGVGMYNVVRVDDNDNKILLVTYETQRVADYYCKLFQNDEQKQLYKVEYMQ